MYDFVESLAVQSMFTTKVSFLLPIVQVVHPFTSRLSRSAPISQLISAVNHLFSYVHEEESAVSETDNFEPKHQQQFEEAVLVRPVFPVQVYISVVSFRTA